VERHRPIEADHGSPSVINQRLSELKAWNLIALSKDGYGLTPSGRALLGLLMPLNDWCQRYVAGGGKLSARDAAVGGTRATRP
jgi:DNA-binding HxlR family transcriptional regulator